MTDGHWPNGIKVDYPCATVHANGGMCLDKTTHSLTVIACECGAQPKRPSGRISTQHVWHQTHRRTLKLQPVEYAWASDSYLVGLSVGPYVRYFNGPDYTCQDPTHRTCGCGKGARR